MLLTLLGGSSGPRIYAVIYPSALGEPSAAQIKAGQNVNSSAATWAGSIASPTSTQTVDWPSLATGLTAGTSYKVSFVWSDGAADSAPETSSAFTTTGGGAFELDASSGAYAAVGAAADVAAERSVEATAGSYAVTGSASDVVAERSVEAQSGGYSLTGASAELVGPAAGFELEALAGAYSATGSIADVAAQREIEASPGAYALAGANADVSAGREVDAVSGVYVATGAGANVDAQREIEASPGTYSLAGASAELVGPAPAFELEALAGSYAATGASADVVAERSVEANSGAYTLSGQGADLAADREVIATAGAYALAGASAEVGIPGQFALEAEAGSYLTSGASAELQAPAREAEQVTGGYEPRRVRYRVRVGRRWVEVDPLDPQSVKRAYKAAEEAAEEAASDRVVDPRKSAARTVAAKPVEQPAGVDYVAMRDEARRISEMVRRVYAESLERELISRLMREKLARDDEDEAGILLSML